MPLKRVGFKQRKTPMRRTKYEGPSYDREPRAISKTTVKALRVGTYSGTTSGVAVEKVVPVEHEGYRRLVAMLPCKNCGIGGYSQAAHPNTNKGAGTKTDDRLCFALCTVHPEGGRLVPGCHAQFDQGALYPKAVRRELEPAWGADTRRTIEAMGEWPANLERWTE